MYIYIFFRTFAADLVACKGAKREAGESPAQSRCCKLKS